jgi:hypothetical protein
MKTSKKLTLEVGLAIFLIYVSSGFLLFTWNSMVGYYLLVLSASLMCGMIIVDFEKSLKIILITFVVGAITFVWLTTLPSTIYGENYKGEINMIVTLISTEFSRTIIISFPAAVFACLFGCFLGKSLMESE